LSLFEAQLPLFSRDPAKPGAAVDLRSWPSSLPADAPRKIASVHLPG